MSLASRIRADYDSGVSLKDIGDMYGLGESDVAHILGRTKAKKSVRQYDVGTMVMAYYSSHSKVYVIVTAKVLNVPATEQGLDHYYQCRYPDGDSIVGATKHSRCEMYFGYPLKPTERCAECNGPHGNDDDYLCPSCRDILVG